MKINPISEYSEPGYPRLEEFIENPRNITNNTPEHWKNNKVVWALLVSLAVSNQSCIHIEKKASRIEIIKTQEKNEAGIISEDEKKIDTSFVAPLFNRGNGIGAYGCIVVMPPIFISEQEAKQIILNELEKENLIFDTISQPKQKIIIRTEKKLYKEKEGDYIVKDTVEMNDLKFDAYNKDLNFAICFLSEEKYSLFTDYEPAESTVYHEDYRKTAEKLRGEIKKTKDLNAVVFYEPIPYPNRDEGWEDAFSEKMINKRKEMAADSLRSQVRDFIKWLKTEKITTR